MFIFEVYCVLEEGFVNVIRESWVSNSDQLPLKLNTLGYCLVELSSHVHCDRKAQKKLLEDRLDILTTEEQNDDVLIEMTNIRLKLNFEAKKEERY